MVCSSCNGHGATEPGESGFCRACNGTGIEPCDVRCCQLPAEIPACDGVPAYCLGHGIEAYAISVGDARAQAAKLSRMMEAV